MKNFAKVGFYSLAGVALTGLGVANAAINVGGVSNQNIVTQGSADVVVQGYIQNAMNFLYLIAVGYALWGGFQILTAGGEDDKVKSGKKIIIQALLGLLVIFLAGTIVEWLTKAILK